MPCALNSPVAFGSTDCQLFEIMDSETVKNIYIISGVTGMTGNELARSLALPGNVVIGFDNFYASSIDTVADILDRAEFIFHEWDLDSAEQMRQY